MSRKSFSPLGSAKRPRWLRVSILVLGPLLLLLIIAYFVGTSSGFFKGVILPRVSRAANATVTVDSASISPFSRMVLRNLKVQTTGAEPLVTATEVRLRYHLFAILGGNLNVDEITLVAPTVTVVQNADGTSNLDPLLKPSAAKEEKPKSEGKPSEPAQIDLKKLSLSNATVRQIRIHQDGQRDLTELSNINVALDGVKNGQAGKLTLNADVKVDNHPPTPAASGMLQAKIAGGFDFTLGADLKSASIRGTTQFGVTQAEGSLGELAALSADFECDITPTEIKQVALRFQKSGAQLGAVRVSGPFDMAKTEGRLTVEVLPLDRRVLNLAGAASGIDFGGTTVQSTNQIELSKAGAIITASGQLTAANMQLTHAEQSTPMLDVRANYSVTVDRAAQTALLRAFTVTTTQYGNPLVRADLSSPMNVTWGNAASAAGDSTLNLDLTALNLGDWRAFAADMAPEGVVNARVKLVSQQSGRQLTFDFEGQVAGLSATLGSNVINRADVRLQAKGSATDFKQFNLESYRLELAQRGEPALTVSGAGTFDSATKDADLQIAVRSALAKLLAIFPQPNLKLASGTLDFKGRVASKQMNQTITGDLDVANLAASATPDRRLTAKLKLDASANKQIAELRQCVLTLTPTARAKNEVQLTGRIDLSKTNAITGNVKLAAEALDLTGYYDLFADKTATTPAQPGQPTQPVATTKPEQKEPEAMNLPFRNLTAEAVIGRLYLRDVDVVGFQTLLKLDNSRALLKPFQMTLNGAPVSATADLNLGVAGYEYDLSFKANGVPIAPLADTFSAAYKGKAKGTLLASAQIKGAGVTGTNLQKSLVGDVSLVLTNANIQLVGPKAGKIMRPIALVLGLEELTRTPLTGLNAQIKMGGGAISVTRCDVTGSAFLADATGEIPISPVLNDSPFNGWPINISLTRNLARKARLIPADAPADAAFVRLPNFATLRGTIGSPEARTDKLVIAGLVARSAGGFMKDLGIGAGKIAEGVGGFFTGQRAATNASTNAPATNAPRFNPFNWFKKNP